MEDDQPDKYDFLGINQDEKDEISEGEEYEEDFNEFEEDNYFTHDDDFNNKESYIKIPFMNMLEYTTLICSISNSIRSSSYDLSEKDLKLVYGNGTDISMAYNIVKHRRELENFPFYILRGNVKMDPLKMFTPLEIETSDIESEEPSFYERYFN